MMGCWLKRERRSVSRCSDSWTMEAIGGRERRESKREYSGAMRKRMRVGREGWQGGEKAEGLIVRGFGVLLQIVLQHDGQMVTQHFGSGFHFFRGHAGLKGREESDEEELEVGIQIGIEKGLESKANQRRGHGGS